MAIKAIQEGKIASIRAAARAYDVPHVTLTRRLKGGAPQRGTPAVTRKLTQQEEEVLVRWILDMDSRGYAPRVGDVSRKANILLTERVRGTPTTPSTVGINWATNFVRRRSELRSDYLRKKDSQRALCEDPSVIQAWFNLVRNVIAKYGVVDDDVWNFDETGFQMGVISTARVVTGSERRGRPVVTQPGNRTWTTVIETIAADGRALDPLIIFAGKVHQEHWFQELQNDEYTNWKLAVSETGWTNDEIGLWWLQEVFEPSTRRSRRGKYRLLILDGHHSHNTPEFNDHCTKHDIIALFMPPHASHLLQPLDVACFSPLKRAYGRRVEELMRLNQHHVDKNDFLRLYIAARSEAFTEHNARAGFRAAGLVPYDSSVVLDQLRPVFRTPTPPLLLPSSQELEQGWDPETPRTVKQVQKHARTLRKSLKRKTILTPSPTNLAAVQMAKATEYAIYAFQLAQERIAELEELIQVRKKRKTTSRKYIKNGKLLSASDVRQEHVDESDEEDEDTIVIRVAGAQRRCGRCGTIGHNSRTCQASNTTA